MLASDFFLTGSCTVRNRADGGEVLLNIIHHREC